jgi:hypothetical protein
MRLSGTFSHKPAAPGEWYESSMPVELVDQNGQPTGLFVFTAGYQPNPEID